MQIRWLALTQLALMMAACSSSHGADDGGPRDAGRVEADAAPIVDSGGPRDAGPGDAGLGDAGSPDGGGPGSTCAAEDARSEPCSLLCDGPGSWHWDGDRCFYIDCGACRGEDCVAGAASQETCEAAHASCAAQQCAATGGDWLWWAEECGHFDCGFPPPQTCETGMAVCDCGSGRRFDEGTGCVLVDCPAVDPLPPETLCPSTGGSWEAICCDTVCGAFCPLACANMACNCGPNRVFDTLRGCVVGRECVERSAGESCAFDAPSRCEDGTICCDACGGAGCAGMPRCIAPVCDDDPDIDVCGTNALAP